MNERANEMRLHGLLADLLVGGIEVVGLIVDAECLACVDHSRNHVVDRHRVDLSP